MTPQLPAGNPPPSPESVRAQLEKILASKAFARAKSPTRARFLRYAVEETLDGRGDEIKETLIGLEVFRLRARLREYYENDGAQDTVIITIP